MSNIVNIIKIRRVEDNSLGAIIYDDCGSEFVFFSKEEEDKIASDALQIIKYMFFILQSNFVDELLEYILTEKADICIEGQIVEHTKFRKLLVDGNGCL